MKKILLSVLVLLSLPFQEAQCKSQSSANVTQATVGAIDTQGLKDLQDSGKSFALVDARTAKYFDGTVIAGAQHLPADATKEMIASTLPSKDTVVVAYCAGVGCPASDMLAKRLAEAGYKHVLDYHGGIRDWMAAGYSTQALR